MDIKVKTSSGVTLADCTHKNIGLHCRTTSEGFRYVVAEENDKIQVLGTYGTEERASEVLKLIETCIDNGFKRQAYGIIIEMPKE